MKTLTTQISAPKLIDAITAAMRDAASNDGHLTPSNPGITIDSDGGIYYGSLLTSASDETVLLDLGMGFGGYDGTPEIEIDNVSKQWAADIIVELQHELDDQMKIEWTTNPEETSTHRVNDGVCSYWIAAPGKTHDEIADMFRDGYDGDLSDGGYQVTDLIADETKKYDE